MFAGYLFLLFKDCREVRQINPSQTLMNLQYILLVPQKTRFSVSWWQRPHNAPFELDLNVS